MKKILFLILLTTFFNSYAQVDYSEKWEAFYSYNNVKDFVKVDRTIYAISDNALFIYNEDEKTYETISTVQGLSGDIITSIFYDEDIERIVLGHDNGLLEIIEKDRKIHIAKDIVNFNFIGDKSINHITQYENRLFISTSFGIVEYNLEKLEFGSTFFINTNSTETKVVKTVILDNDIYAATSDGLFKADVTSEFLIDSNNWEKISSSEINAIAVFQNNINVGIGKQIFKIENDVLVLKSTRSNDIINLTSNTEQLVVSFEFGMNVLDSNYNTLSGVGTGINGLKFRVNNSYTYENKFYVATDSKGILNSSIYSFVNMLKIHPDGPSSNKIFSLESQNHNIWAVYGGYNQIYTPEEKRAGYSHFDGETWNNIPYDENLKMTDLVSITISPENPEIAYYSSWGEGILVTENDEPIQVWNETNSTLESLTTNYREIRIDGKSFDRDGNLWVSNSWNVRNIHKYSVDGEWTSYEVPTLNTNYGINEMVIDETNTIWVGTNNLGLVAYNPNDNITKRFSLNSSKGNLPSENVRTIAIDSDNTMWIGTKLGLVVYRNAPNVVNVNQYAAEPVIILDDGIPKKLLGEQVINSIAIDGSDNKWFGTRNSGVINTNSSGEETLNIFTKDNSPLPSNTILKVKIDNINGKVYFLTDKGLVAYNSNVVPFSDGLEEVYAYPNPATKEHNEVTIDGRYGTHLPKGTNVKILDVAGNLVFEANADEGESTTGGKIVWNKRNLAGRKVASGIYIVLLTTEDRSETQMTKIAIVN
ncbi:two-component regulator propeller domain-containing protein [Aureivirga sp. CE67]|uniref:type IX secretion system anionic LPS delivery protein PorZ n=1 Tax=Aureivirga sp. CE67 TaxID=1788983 RepID=UPI0018C9DDE9|nr:two-component regulator propeller domain-containing protein [Aureivirga sp. CE67]